MERGRWRAWHLIDRLGKAMSTISSHRALVPHYKMKEKIPLSGHTSTGPDFMPFSS